MPKSCRCDTSSSATSYHKADTVWHAVTHSHSYLVLHMRVPYRGAMVQRPLSPRHRLACSCLILRWQRLPTNSHFMMRAQNWGAEDEAAADALHISRSGPLPMTRHVPHLHELCLTTCLLAC